MTELDLNALGIWWIPIPNLRDLDGASVNAWAIENEDGSFTLFDCGLDSPESLAALQNGLARSGASLGDVGGLVLSHAHSEHSGGARRVLDRARLDAVIFASDAEARTLGSALGSVSTIRDGDRFSFRHFAATVVETPGHTRGLVCLFADEKQVLFSSDQLVFSPVPSVLLGLDEPASATFDPLGAFRDSLRRVAALDVRVVLPGRGAPFAGHRRVVRETLSRLPSPAGSKQDPGVGAHEASR